MGLNVSSLIGGAVKSRRNGHVYTSIVTQDNAQAHCGDRIAAQNLHARFSLWPPLPSAGDVGRAGHDRRVAKRKRIQDADAEELPRQGQDPVEMAVDHLGELYISARRFEQDKNAQRLARWIRVLVSTFTDENAATQLEHTLDVLESLQTGLLSVNRVSINSASSSRRTLPSNVLKATRKSSVVTVVTWEIRLDTVMCDSIDATNKDVKGCFSSLRLKPARSPGPGATMFSIFFGGRTDYLQRSFFSPTIITYRTVDSSAEVFELVGNDDVDGLVKLVALQKASARDCDADGRSLFFVRTPAMTKKCLRRLLTSVATVVYDAASS
jgi:hypothetical protein